MANYVENIKVGSGETWPVRDVDAHEKITALQTSLTTTNNAVNNAQTSADNAQSAADKAQSAAESAADNSWMLVGGTAIPSGADLFTYTTIGNYTCSTNAIAASLTNCPVTVAFTLKVMPGRGTATSTGSTDIIRLELRPHSPASGILYVASAQTSDSGANWTWSGWYKAANQTDVDGKAPKSHASTATTYGIGTGSNYGHVKLSDSTSSTSAASAGIAASPAAVKAAYDLAAAAMPKSGGTFTGNTKAYETARTTRGIFNDETRASSTSGTLQSVKYFINVT